jgi:4-diphosphocytidyl-2-C-methyl-D-erythritol kinase
MITFPRAKINLGLRVTGRRHDGYHDIESLFYPINLCDAMEFVVAGAKAGNDILETTGVHVPGRIADNLVIKAAATMREHFKIPFLRIHLHKVIPAGAGLGGGSSDASSLLKCLNRYFGLSASEKELEAIAAGIGSDCPFFLHGVPSHVTGRGEIMSEINPFLEGLYIVLLNPGININTRDAYLNCHPVKPRISLAEIIKRSPDGWKKSIRNDFEDYAFKLYPEIGKLKSELYKSGAFYSSMTGSGSSVFGLFNGKPSLPLKLSRHLIYEGIL